MLPAENEEKGQEDKNSNINSFNLNKDINFTINLPDWYNINSKININENNQTECIKNNNIIGFPKSKFSTFSFTNEIFATNQEQNEQIERGHMENFMWNNLIYIKLKFLINEFEFEEEFLWDRRRNSSNEIKQFAFELVREKVLDSDNQYKPGVKSMTFDFLDLCGEYIAFMIKKEIYFYDKFKPLQNLRLGLYGNGSGINNEYLIPIKIDIKKENEEYKDEFSWDILSEANIPEIFAQKIVLDLKLSKIFILLISMEIRKQIKEYVFDLFKTISNIITHFEKEQIRKRNKKNHYKKSSMKNFKFQKVFTKLLSDPYAIEPPLMEQLGKKHKRTETTTIPDT